MGIIFSPLFQKIIQEQKSDHVLDEEIIEGRCFIVTFFEAMLKASR